MTDKIINFLGHYAESYGYYIALAFAFFENSIFIGLFLPGGIVVIFLGFFAAQGKLDPLPLLGYLLAGTLAGNNVGYFLGHKFGRKIVKKVGRVFSFEEEYFQKAEKFYKKHGTKTVLWGRFIAMVGPFVPFTAGISNMEYTRFLVYDFVGAIGWSVWLTSLGYFFGANWHRINNILGDIGIVAFIIFAFLIYRYIRSQKNEND